MKIVQKGLLNSAFCCGQYFVGNPFVSAVFDALCEAFDIAKPFGVVIRNRWLQRMSS
jgi:hypothetical protein